MCIKKNVDNTHQTAGNWKKLDANDEYSSSVESGFFEDEEPISQDDSLDNLLQLASEITEKEKKYTRMSMEIVFHAEFVLCFARYLRDPWYLIPVTTGSPLPTDTLCSVEIAKVRFECSNCGNCWTSMQSYATFFYRLKDGSGELYLQLPSQECSICTKEANPLWYPDEICRIMKNTFCNVCKRLYPNIKCKFTPNYERRKGEPKGMHNCERCLSCREGICIYQNK